MYQANPGGGGEEEGKKTFRKNKGGVGPGLGWGEKLGRRTRRDTRGQWASGGVRDNGLSVRGLEGGRGCGGLTALRQLLQTKW